VADQGVFATREDAERYIALKGWEYHEDIVIEKQPLYPVII